MATQVLVTAADGSEIDVSRWNIVYPNYLNSAKTVPEGRRIAKTKCVENPTIAEMGEACRELGVPCVLEDKCYPRDWLIRGRLRVRIIDDSGKPLRADIDGKRQLLEKISEVIPTLKSRTHPQKEENHGAGGGGAKETTAAATAASSSKGGQHQQQQQHRSNKKKNKRNK
ncbi:signal recognition particle 19kDa [Perkinsus chesapeaki]|uniref:Signal recognition particle 19kDa n=1 Tax=Perkinsus chesapeaki TaxID=330153 RepID=A0A7J6M7P6_PERCH|nr:signal recognition particle 19kDa [Perkinsus chesapeaki]